jgi:hypothetical protein
MRPANAHCVKHVQSSFKAEHFQSQPRICGVASQLAIISRNKFVLYLQKDPKMYVQDRLENGSRSSYLL